LTIVPDPIAPFAPRERTLPAMLERQAARFGTRTLFVVGEARWRYDDAREHAARFGGALRAAGVCEGDRVALMCTNRVEFMQVFLGCGWIGAIAVPINVASRGESLRHVLVNCGARLLVIEGALLGAVTDLGAATLPLERLWIVGAGAQCAPPELAREAFPAAGDAVDPAPVRPGQTAAILYTSGTTGPSKGVCCPHAQFYWWGVHTGRMLGLRDGDVLHTTLPLFHTNALNTFYQALLTGSSQVLERRFSASAFWESLAARDATVTYLLGAMVPILLSKDPGEHDRGHRVRIALGPGVPPQFHARFRERFGVQLVEGYGSTETNFVIGAEAHEQRPGTMGRVRAGFEARVVDDEDNPLADGEAGELVLHASEPYAFATGYFAMADKTVEAWRNLWFHTGDRVVRDPDGFFRFVDRLKDAIRRRGENISSFEVERVILGHPAVETAAVFPVKSELAEDEVMAAVVLRAGATLSASELVAHCEPSLPYFAVPRFVEFVASLPATENGKIEKFRLRERGVTGQTWDREAAGYRLASRPPG
jgi:crotonobetaine/carnitine-CoA ligase